MNHCDCHPWTPDDEKVWKIVKNQPRTKAQWEALHNSIEDYRRLLIEDWKRRTPVSAPPQKGAAES